MLSHERLIEILQEAPRRPEVFSAVATLNLPDCYVAGGFVRNAVWDALYGKKEQSPINDVDVVYFKPLSVYGVDEADLLEQIVRIEPNPVWREEDEARARLEELVPGLVFEVKNQARMHLSPAKTHQHAPYHSLEDALSDWVETSTPIGVREEGDVLNIVAPQGLDDLFAGILRATRKEHETRLRERAHEKGWLTLWPQLRFEPCNE